MRRFTQSFAEMVNEYKTPALLAMLIATLMMAFAPIFVRLCDLNGSSMTFWRMILASPFLMLGWLFLPVSPRRHPVYEPNAKAYGLLILAGIAFAVDLIVWNYGVAFTTVANATLFVNFAPLIVAFINWKFLKKPLSRNLILGMFTAILGGFFLTWPHLSSAPDLFLGDSLSLLAACFYGVYLVSVHEARKFFNTCFIMVVTGFITALTAFAAALILNHPLNIETVGSWQALIGLALVVQVFGQGLITCAMGGLSSTLSALFLLMQPVFSAIIAWQLFEEELIALQMLGMVVILLGIGLARISESKPAYP